MFEQLALSTLFIFAGFVCLLLWPVLGNFKNSNLTEAGLTSLQRQGVLLLVAGLVLFAIGW